MTSAGMQPAVVMNSHLLHSAPHARRSPAHRSVSLLHSPRARSRLSAQRGESSSNSESLQSRPSLGYKKLSEDSVSSTRALHKDSSGESSNAERWFERSNNEVSNTRAAVADTEPPFFLRNPSSSSTPPDVQERMNNSLHADHARSVQQHTSLLHLGTDGSTAEDFRGVIDDLTIENKKLKRRLRKYEKLHDSHLKDEKLFEVRVHGLPADKMRDFEETLRKFASSLSNVPGSDAPLQNAEGLVPATMTHHTSSSQASAHVADSAYASMSASGKGSAGQSAHDRRVKRLAQSVKSRQQNIHSYLHHIPEGLLPQQNPTGMSEMSKRKLVVRRLEQIFTGKGAATGGHQQPLQQQAVSQLAAEDDRFAAAAQGQYTSAEGLREASIMLHETEDPADPSTIGKMDRSSDDSTNHYQRSIHIAEQDFVDHSANQLFTEQRPTRPLDLDPHRAQVPQDNINYIKHLGFSPPGSRTPEEGHGWMYLNLLVNMAQLHTFNVTSNFVRNAVQEGSSKFEISTDGRKVRWTGGRNLSRSTGDDSSSICDTGDSTLSDGRPRKRVKLSVDENPISTVPSGLLRGNDSRYSKAGTTSSLTYTPLFFHNPKDDEGDTSLEAELDGMSMAAVNSSGKADTRMKPSSNRSDDDQNGGPIIFYNNAKFCTDLSGDRSGVSGNQNAPPYKSLTRLPVGQSHTTNKVRAAEKRGPLDEASELPEPMDLADNPIPQSMELSFPERSPVQSRSESSDEPMELEVSGIGGVQPADNFAIHVSSRHGLASNTTAPGPCRASPKFYPSRIAEMLRCSTRNLRPAVHKQVITADRRDLPPSDLPPALFFVSNDEESTSEDDTEDDDDSSFITRSVDTLPPATAPQVINMPFIGSDASDNEEEEDEDEDEDDESDDESEGSLDLLATARELDPASIRAQEREYDANVAERLAEEIPAGSSAATAGGGSGFPSPASDFKEVDEMRRNLKRSMGSDTTSENMSVSS